MSCGDVINLPEKDDISGSWVFGMGLSICFCFICVGCERWRWRRRRRDWVKEHMDDVDTI